MSHEDNLRNKNRDTRIPSKDNHSTTREHSKGNKPKTVVISDSDPDTSDPPPRAATSRSHDAASRSSAAATRPSLIVQPVIKVTRGAAPSKAESQQNGPYPSNTFSDLTSRAGPSTSRAGTSSSNKAMAPPQGMSFGPLDPEKKKGREPANYPGGSGSSGTKTSGIVEGIRSSDGQWGQGGPQSGTSNSRQNGGGARGRAREVGARAVFEHALNQAGNPHKQPGKRPGVGPATVTKSRIMALPTSKRQTSDSQTNPPSCASARASPLPPLDIKGTAAKVTGKGKGKQPVVELRGDSEDEIEEDSDDQVRISLNVPLNVRPAPFRQSREPLESRDDSSDPIAMEHGGSTSGHSLLTANGIAHSNSRVKDRIEAFESRNPQSVKSKMKGKSRVPLLPKSKKIGGGGSDDDYTPALLPSTSKSATSSKHMFLTPIEPCCLNQEHFNKRNIFQNHLLGLHAVGPGNSWKLSVNCLDVEVLGLKAADLESILVSLPTHPKRIYMEVALKEKALSSVLRGLGLPPLALGDDRVLVFWGETSSEAKGLVEKLREWGPKSSISKVGSIPDIGVDTSIELLESVLENNRMEERERSTTTAQKSPPPPPKAKRKSNVKTHDPDQLKLTFQPEMRESPEIVLAVRKSARQSNAAFATRDASPAPVVPRIPPDKIVLVWPLPKRVDGIALPVDFKAGAVTLTHGDLKRLDPEEFLNDSLIEFGLKQISVALETSQPTVASQVHMFNSFFYKKLTTKKPPSAGPDWNVHDTVQKWTAKFDLFEKKFVVVPINEHLHWYLAIIVNPAAFLRKPKPKPIPARRQTRASLSNTIQIDSDNEDQTSHHFEDASNGVAKPEDGEVAQEELKAQFQKAVAERPLNAKIPEDADKADYMEIDDFEKDLSEVAMDVDDVEEVGSSIGVIPETPSLEQKNDKPLTGPMEYVELDELASPEAEAEAEAEPSAPLAHPTQVNGSQPKSTLPIVATPILPSLHAPRGRSPPRESTPPPRSSTPALPTPPPPVDYPPRIETELGNALFKVLDPDVCHIFTFDSLGSTHNPVVKKLRSYLVREAHHKKGIPVNQGEDVECSGHSVSVPQQPNFCDCGLYLLHYVEEFLFDAIKKCSCILDPPGKSDKSYSVQEEWKGEKAGMKRGAMREEVTKLSAEWKEYRKPFEAEEKKAEELRREKKKIRDQEALEANGGVEPERVQKKVEPVKVAPKGKGKKGKEKTAEAIIISSDDEETPSPAKPATLKTPRLVASKEPSPDIRSPLPLPGNSEPASAAAASSKNNDSPPSKSNPNQASATSDKMAVDRTEAPLPDSDDILFTETTGSTTAAPRVVASKRKPRASAPPQPQSDDPIVSSSSKPQVPPASADRTRPPIHPPGVLSAPPIHPSVLSAPRPPTEQFLPPPRRRSSEEAGGSPPFESSNKKQKVSNQQPPPPPRAESSTGTHTRFDDTGAESSSHSIIIEKEEMEKEKEVRKQRGKEKDRKGKGKGRVEDEIVDASGGGQIPEDRLFDNDDHLDPQAGMKRPREFINLLDDDDEEGEAEGKGKGLGPDKTRSTKVQQRGVHPSTFVIPSLLVPNVGGSSASAGALAGTRPTVGSMGNGKKGNGDSQCDTLVLED